MDRFSKFHPIISFLFFIGVIALTIVFTNSFFTAVSFLCSFCYSVKLKGKKAVSYLLKFTFPIVLFAGIFNMLFAGYGKHILFSVKGINFTTECLASGLFTGVMIGAVIMWFLSYNEIVTSDRFMAIFGGIMPNFALLFSMILRFIPLMIKTSDEIKDAHKGLGTETKGIKNTLSRFSALLSISLEKSIETADSMKSRGFGTKKRSFYSAYEFRKSDFAALMLIAVLIIYLFAAGFMEYPQISFNPVIEIKSIHYFSLILFFVYALFPLIADLSEDVKWLLLKSKI